MGIDMHCHVAGNCRDITKADEEFYFNPYDNAFEGNLFFVWRLYKYVELMLAMMGADSEGAESRLRLWRVRGKI